MHRKFRRNVSRNLNVLRNSNVLRSGQLELTSTNVSRSLIIASPYSVLNGFHVSVPIVDFFFTAAPLK